MTLALYHNVAVCAQKVRLALAEKYLPYESRLLDLRAGESHTPEYIKLNPNGVEPFQHWLIMEVPLLSLRLSTSS